MDIIQVIEIIALVLGIPYIVLEVLQKNSMWYFGIITSSACAIQFFLQHNWANMGLNIYYVVMAVWGLYQWTKDSRALDEAGAKDGADIHLSRLTPAAAVLSLVVFIAGTAILIRALQLMNDSSACLDAVSTALCVIAMFWLAKSIPWHWILWIVGDALLVIMCWKAGMVWMTILYLSYIAASAYGLYRWFKHGRYVS